MLYSKCRKRPKQSTIINILTFAYILPLQAQTVFLYNKTFYFRLQNFDSLTLCSCTGNQMIDYWKFRSCAQLISDWLNYWAKLKIKTATSI